MKDFIISAASAATATSADRYSGAIFNSSGQTIIVDQIIVCYRDTSSPAEGHFQFQRLSARGTPAATETIAADHLLGLQNLGGLSNVFLDVGQYSAEPTDKAGQCVKFMLSAADGPAFVIVFPGGCRIPTGEGLGARSSTADGIADVHWTFMGKL